MTHKVQAQLYEIKKSRTTVSLRDDLEKQFHEVRVFSSDPEVILYKQSEGNRGYMESFAAISAEHFTSKEMDLLCEKKRVTSREEYIDILASKSPDQYLYYTAKPVFVNIKENFLDG